jgi:hypothetical protein
MNCLKIGRDRPFTRKEKIPNLSVIWMRVVSSNSEILVFYNMNWMIILYIRHFVNYLCFMVTLDED